MKRILLFVCSFLCLNATSVFAQDLRIIIFSVGQTDSQLIIGPTNRTLLIDVGAEVAGPKKQYEYVAQRIKDLTPAGRIDYFVISHYHYDHMGNRYPNSVLGNGLWGLLDRENIEIVQVIDRGDVTAFGPQTSSHSKYLEDLPGWLQRQAIGSRVTATLGTGQIDLGGSVVVEIVAVGGNDVLGGVNQNDPDRFIDFPPSENDYSLALKISLGEFEYFTGGDLTGADDLRSFGPGSSWSYNDIESSIASAVGDVEVLRVSHHGSAHSTNEAFLAALDPEFSIVSSGSNNYGHPATATVERVTGTSRTLITSGFDQAVWANDPQISTYVQDSDIEISVHNGGADYEIAGFTAQSFTALQESSGFDSQNSFPATGQVISWQDVANHVGENVVVEGTIVATRELPAIAFLNFSDQWWRDLTAVINQADRSQFPNDLSSAYEGRSVLVSGEIELYEGRPQIVISDPAQIEVLP